MKEPAALVYDLDGTLVRLPVDWEAVARDVKEVYRDAGVAIEEGTLWELLEAAQDKPFADLIESVIANHERTGAERAELLPPAEALPSLTVPVAVCSLNCEAACRISLERHHLLKHVDAIVGRDSVSTMKPAPEPLLAAIDTIAAEPEETLFIGDSERDAVTATRAGTCFAFVSDIQSSW